MDGGEHKGRSKGGKVSGRRGEVKEGDKGEQCSWQADSG